MSKQTWKPGTLLYPVPAVLVSCGDFEKKTHNLITIAWAGTICSDPAMVSISVRPERYSFELIQDSQEFVINLPTTQMVKAVDFCGVKSGRELDKFNATGLTPVKATIVKAPLIKEAPLALECRVTQTISLGSHHLFLAEVLNVQVEEALINESGKLNLDQADLFTYLHGQYWSLDKPLGKFGFSVQKK